jgi:signal transduction histidine kinase
MTGASRSVRGARVPGNGRKRHFAFNGLNGAPVAHPQGYSPTDLSARGSIAVTAAVAALFTVVVSIGSVVSFAYRNVPLHVAVETAAALISLMGAQLAWGRFRQSLKRNDLLLAGSLAVFAATNFLFSAIPAIADSEPGSFATWAPAGGRLLGAALLAASAVVSDQVLRRPMRDAGRLLGAIAIALGVLTLAVAVGGDALPKAVPADLSPIRGSRPRIVGNPVVLASELLSMALFAVAAVGYARAADVRHDAFAHWLAIAATLAAFSRLNFFLFPSLYSPYFYTGDVLRLGFFTAVAVGGLLEMRRLRRVLASAAVLEERQRIAMEIHDGVAQDLAFILQQGRGLVAEAGAPRRLPALVSAAERALDECRHAIAALTRNVDEPLAEALTLTAIETAGREGAEIETRIEADVAVTAVIQEALLRVMREAIINAARHGRAGTVKVEFRSDPLLQLVVSDDGTGFDVARAMSAPGRMGLRGMQARINGIGGELDIQSWPGHGTRVAVTLP